MIYEKLYLKNVFDGIDTNAELCAYVRSNCSEIAPDRRRASVLICPGGGYGFVSRREAEPVALAFLAKGYNAFVLDYSTRDTSDKLYPAQLLEVSAALAYIRQKSEYYNVKENAVSVCGFSAGGHLACSLGAFWNEKFIEETLGIAHGENKPDGMILAYPVISGGEHAHRGSFDNLLGENAEDELLHKMSLENSVGEHTPPAFIWHTLNDGVVPSENSFLLASALKKAGIAFEMHIYPEGPHGLALGNEETKSALYDRVNTHVESWIDLCAKWIAKYIDK